MSNSRYLNRPLLRLLELYVLSAIDEISDEDAGRMVAMTPKLREIYGQSGDWQDIIAASVGLPDEASSHIKTLWEESKVRAASPQRFAEMFVDDIFRSGQ